MGSYASHADIHHPTQAWDLAEYCTACHNTGVVEYPVTVHESEEDPCPHGCLPADELLEAGEEEAWLTGHHDQWLALQDDEYHTLPDEEMERLAQIMLNETIQARATDPLMTLQKQFRRGKSKFQTSLAEEPRHHGLVSSDDYIPGFMRSGREVKHISIPPYLVAQVMDWDDDYAHLQYEYVGSRLDVFVAHDTLMNRMRFAHSWDKDFRSHVVMA